MESKWCEEGESDQKLGPKLGVRSRVPYRRRLLRGIRLRANLVIVGAADSDGDGLADSFDDCPAVSNIDQARAVLGCIPLR